MPVERDRRPEPKADRAGLVDVVAYAAIAFLYTRDMGTSIRRVLTRLGGALDVTHTMLLSLEEDGREWAWAPGTPPDPRRTRSALTRADSWIKQLSEGSVIAANAGRGSHDDQVALDAMGAKTAIVAPILVDGGWWGVLAALGDRGPRVWSPIHRKLMLAVAGTLGSALMADRQRTCLAESRVHLREARSRADGYRVRLDEFIVASQDAIVLIEPDGFVSRWNKAADTLFGIDAFARPGRTYRDILPFAGRPSIGDLVDQARLGTASHAQPFDIVGRNGLRNVLVSVLPLGSPPGTVAVLVKDETESAIFRHKLERSMAAAVAALAAAVETRDPYTAGHQQRTAELARSIARLMALPDDSIRGIYTAAIIHDIGKIMVPSEILTCPRRLHDPEFALIQMHCQAGYEIVKGIDFPWPVPSMILQHHERMDGSGYPSGLEGDAILIGARIIGVADAVEAITNHRPYRAALGVDAAREAVSRGAGRQFDPEVVRACLAVLDRDGLPG